MLPSWMRSRKPKSAVGVALGQAHDQAQVGLGQFLLGAPALVLAGGDDFDRTAELLAGRLDPPLDRLHGALRLADAGGDIEQVLAGAVDLEHVAAILGLGRLLD